MCLCSDQEIRIIQWASLTVSVMGEKWIPKCRCCLIHCSPSQMGKFHHRLKAINHRRPWLHNKTLIQQTARLIHLLAQCCNDVPDRDGESTVFLCVCGEYWWSRPTLPRHQSHSHSSIAILLLPSLCSCFFFLTYISRIFPPSLHSLSLSLAGWHLSLSHCLCTVAHFHLHSPESYGIFSDFAWRSWVKQWIPCTDGHIITPRLV